MWCNGGLKVEVAAVTYNERPPWRAVNWRVNFGHVTSTAGIIFRLNETTPRNHPPSKEVYQLEGKKSGDSTDEIIVLSNTENDLLGRPANLVSISFSSTRRHASQEEGRPEGQEAGGF